jgi:large subunit ribosomal protein L18
MKAIERKRFQRSRRKRRVRGSVTGTQERPRLSVFRSNQNIYAQIIDDIRGATLVSASSRDKTLSSDVGYGGNKAAAAKVGAALAAKAVGAGIKAVVFDRNGYKYHGRVKELADAARKGGLSF